MAARVENAATKAVEACSNAGEYKDTTPAMHALKTAANGLVVESYFYKINLIFIRYGFFVQIAVIYVTFLLLISSIFS